jgi:hypothetical protein
VVKVWKTNIHLPPPVVLGSKVEGPEIWRCHLEGIRNFIIRIQVFNSDKPVLVFFDVCMAIDQGGCGGLAWERAYMLKDKYMCPDPHRGSCGWHRLALWCLV